MANGPFTIVWEAVPHTEWNNPDAVWERREKEIADELTAVRHWGSLKMYENTRPVSVTPEPDWGAYTYDGRTRCTR